MEEVKETKEEKVIKKDLNQQEVRIELHGESNSRGRGRSSVERKQAYAKYRQIKKRVIDLESRNDEFLILFPASDFETNKNKFYIMGGVSAIIYVHEIGKRLGRKPHLRRDMDNGAEKFHSGVCSIQKLDELEKKLKEIGIERVKIEKEGYNEIVFFKLHRKYENKEIKQMLKAEQEDLDNLNKLLYSNVLYPDIHKLILDLKRIVPAKVKNMDKGYREVVGMKVIDALMAIIETYSKMTHGDMDERMGAQYMLEQLDVMFADVSMMNELRVWDVSACIRVGDIVAGLKKTIKSNITNKYKEAEDAAD